MFPNSPGVTTNQNGPKTVHRNSNRNNLVLINIIPSFLNLMTKKNYKNYKHNLVINISAQQKTRSRAIKMGTSIYHKITFSAWGISYECSKATNIYLRSSLNEQLFSQLSSTDVDLNGEDLS